MVADESPARWAKIQLTTYPRRPRVLLGVMFVCVSYFYVSTLKSLSTNGPISSGFYNDSASPKQAWPALAYDNVVNMPIWPDYVHRSPKGVPVTIIVSVFNQEGTIQQTLEALLDKTEGPFELIGELSPPSAVVPLSSISTSSLPISLPSPPDGPWSYLIRRS